VEADPVVSVILFNDEFGFDNEAKFDIDTSESNVLRVGTVKGRTTLCLWDPDKEHMSCRN
jgi:hypothetical protein